MFNLLMFNVDWKPGKVSVPAGRMFEYTDTPITEQFRSGGVPNFDRLISLPCLFCREGTTTETAYVGRISRARIIAKELLLEVSFDIEVPPIQNSMMHARRMELDIRDDFEFARNHWAVKEVGLVSVLAQKPASTSSAPCRLPYFRTRKD